MRGFIFFRSIRSWCESPAEHRLAPRSFYPGASTLNPIIFNIDGTITQPTNNAPQPILSSFDPDLMASLTKQADVYGGYETTMYPTDDPTKSVWETTLGPVGTIYYLYENVDDGRDGQCEWW